MSIRYRPAVECKDKRNPVSIGEVSDFGSKLNQLANIAGVMVARSGYQSGAIDYAKPSDKKSASFWMKEHIKECIHCSEWSKNYEKLTPIHKSVRLINTYENRK